MTNAPARISGPVVGPPKIERGSFMHIQKSIVAAVAVLAIGGPCAAATQSKEAPAAQAVVAAAVAVAGASQASTSAPSRYCMKDTLPGTRITRSFCKSRQQWFTAGVDLPTP
jgi:hypothetical protein